MRYRETIFPVVLVNTAARLRANQNILFSVMLYSALSLLAVLV
jgi:hypothetical protein